MTTPRPHGSDRPAIPVTLVHACLRDGTGGSPTAVVDETGLRVLDDDARRRIPPLAGTSHAVFLATRPDGGTSVRFFTTEGELPACGHGTVAALAYLAERADEADPTYRAALRTTDGRTVSGEASRRDGLLRAEFEVGPVALRQPTAQELGLLLPALGLPLVATARVATLGRPRLLLRVPSRGALEGLAPDLPALAEACRSLDLLGCYAYAAVAGPGLRYAARMFAPAIGVPEDIANANSTACLAALRHTADGLGAGFTVDMGDRLGSPATISASPAPGAASLVRVGGLARVDAPSQLDLSHTAL